MVYLFKIAMRNIGRNKRRTLFTLSAIGIAVAVLTFGESYLNGMINNTFQNYIRIESGHIKIFQEDYPKKKRMAPLDPVIKNYNTLETNIENRYESVTDISERIRFGVMLNVNNKNENCIGMGIYPHKETNILNLEEFIIKGEYIEKESEQMLIGNKLANQLGVAPGDTITIITRTAYNSIGAVNLVIKGIFQSGFGYMDRKFFYAPLSTIQDLLDMNGLVTEMVIMLDDDDKSERIAADIEKTMLSDEYVAISWKKQGDIVTALMNSKAVAFIIFVILMIIAGSTMVNTMLMAVMERTKEIGMMMALGMKGKRIITVFVLEALAIGILGGILGSMLGIGISTYLEETGINLKGAADVVKDFPIRNKLYPDWSLIYTFRAFLYGLITSVIAAFYPARKASKMDPIKALRTV